MSLTDLELQWRREFDAQREEQVAASIELGQATYLLRRVAGWTLDDPLHDSRLRSEVAAFLKSWGHEPTDLGQRALL